MLYSGRGRSKFRGEAMFALLGRLPIETRDKKPSGVLSVLERYGCVLVRGLVPREAALVTHRRIIQNLNRLREVVGDYETDANKNVFSIAIAMAEQDDETLPARMRATLQSGSFQNPAFVTEVELRRLDQVYAPIVAALDYRFDASGRDTAYCRYEIARPNSPYGSYFIHQDGALGLLPDGLTAWVALTDCGEDAPSLQIIPSKWEGRVKTAGPGACHISPELLPDSLFLRPIYRPGDVVIFNAWAVHGTFITPAMRKARTSLDVRLQPR